jgi:hypothetical protein
MNFKKVAVRQLPDGWGNVEEKQHEEKSEVDLLK